MSVSSRVEYSRICISLLFFISLLLLLRCIIDVHYIQLSGIRHDNQSQPVLLIEMSPSSSPHAHIEFELFPMDQKSDYRLHFTVEPVKAIYDAVS
jgi:hypothetical protein